MTFFLSRFLSLSVSLVVACVYTTPISKADEQSNLLSYRKIYFHNPESNINNFRSLKISFDTYLSVFGKFQFQPFENKETFEKMLENTQGSVFLLSSWHYQFLRKNKQIKPILIAEFNGKSVQKKVLLVKSTQLRFSDLKGKMIATAGNEQYSRNLLYEMFPLQSKESIELIKFLVVPTDMNALISLNYGMAAAALSSEISLNQLKIVNPKLAIQLNAIGKSKEKLRTVAVIKQGDKKAQELVDVLLQMNKTEDGKKRLRLLGLDGWHYLTPPELKQLQFQGGVE
ncbi:MAG: PhnD/SsuA/transferrin family substrate-binding protein [Methylococcales bacterium]|nr:PhnD/SsuA/transferrin family substrate-binding protein [Methylococcales bacterium]